jgi:hypothetical protein
MSYNRALIERLAKDRAGQAHGRDRRRPPISHRNPARSVRSRAGWLLIGLGMRLLTGTARASRQLNAATGR